MSEYSYCGSELIIFEQALRWKNYIKGLIQPYLVSPVLEVGAGLGSTTSILSKDFQGKWVCLEPDSKLVEILKGRQIKNELSSEHSILHGNLGQLTSETKFGSVIYIDVLEHIQNDKEELLQAAQLLLPGGCLIILSPAHQSLFTAFDKEIGHYRRYNKLTLQNIAPPDLKLVFLGYLDSAGIAASLCNRLVLKQAMPTLKQILFWDKHLIPISIIMDKLLNFRIGKSILGIWQKER